MKILVNYYRSPYLFRIQRDLLNFTSILAATSHVTESNMLEHYVPQRNA